MPSRPLVIWLVTGIAIVIGALLVLMAGVVGGQVITWDVKGRVLTGFDLALFSVAVGAVGVCAWLAAYGLWRGRAWGRLLAIGFWIAAGGLGLITDRSVPGPGEPTRTYLVHMMLIPGALTALLLFGVPSVRRFFGTGEPEHNVLDHAGSAGRQPNDGGARPTNGPPRPEPEKDRYAK
jgi:hypothetical protein